MIQTKLAGNIELDLAARFSRQEREFRERLMVVWQLHLERLATLLRRMYPNKSIKQHIGDQAFWDEWRARYEPVVIDFITLITDEGVQEAEVILGQMGVGVDTAAARGRYVQWARTHGLDLVRRMTQTDKTALRAELATWLTTDEGLPGLVDRMRVVLRNDRRSFLIASTESTNAFYWGNYFVWKESKVVQGKQWYTRQDERVCVICGPLHEVIVPLDDTFDTMVGPLDGPSAHPGCRCNVRPFIEFFEQ